MDNDFLPYGRQSITEDDVSSVHNVLKSSFLTQGPVGLAFEEALAEKVAAPFAIAVNSATSALHLTCLGLNLGSGDILWTSPTTFVASANCALYCGATVDFVDIDPFTGLVSISALDKKLQEAATLNCLPKIFVPVHLAGTSCPMSEIRELCNAYDVYVVEDASHAIGASYSDSPVGSCNFSDATIFSFHPVKIITTGEGGAVTTRDPTLANRISELRSHGVTKNSDNFIFDSPGPWYYEQQALGYNYRMPDINAALGLSQLSRLDEIVSERNRLLDYYNYLFKDLALRLLLVPDNCISSVHLAVIRLLEASPSLHRDLFVYLRESGIGVQLHYYPVHLQPYYRSMGFAPGDFPESEKYSVDAISIPIFPGLSRDDQIRVADSIKYFLNR